MPGCRPESDIHAPGTQDSRSAKWNSAGETMFDPGKRPRPLWCDHYFPSALQEDWATFKITHLKPRPGEVLGSASELRTNLAITRVMRHGTKNSP